MMVNKGNRNKAVHKMEGEQRKRKKRKGLERKKTREKSRVIVVLAECSSFG